MKGAFIFRAELGHVEHLREICVRTFSETYESLNTPENFRKYIEEHFSRQRLRQEISDPVSFTYLVKLNDKIAGYYKINQGDAQTESMGRNCVELERLYVLRQHQGGGLGVLMMDDACRRSKETGARFIWLGVWEKNTKAIAFYEKYGFVKFGEHIFTLGHDEQNDLMYRFDLK